jgi:hypothetical protein
MRAIAFVSCAALVGCASTGSQAEPAEIPQQTMRVTTVGGSTMTVGSTPSVGPAGGTVAYSADRVWSIIRTVYDTLGIQVTTFDPAGRSIGNPNLKARRRLGDARLSKYLNCGTTQGGPSADSYEVQLSVMTSAQPKSAEATSILTTVDGRARPITISSEFTQCASTGALEAQIVELVKARLR